MQDAALLLKSKRIARTAWAFRIFRVRISASREFLWSTCRGTALAEKGGRRYGGYRRAREGRRRRTVCGSTETVNIYGIARGRYMQGGNVVRWASALPAWLPLWHIEAIPAATCPTYIRFHLTFFFLSFFPPPLPPTARSLSSPRFSPGKEKILEICTRYAAHYVYICAYLNVAKFKVLFRGGFISAV